MLVPHTSKALRCRKKFLRYFPKGFRDKKYFDWERGYKQAANEQWKISLGKTEFRKLIKSGEFEEITRRAVNIETKTNLLFSFEKMALRDAVKSRAGAQLFAENLFELVYGTKKIAERFESFSAMLNELPRKQTRVRTWPLATVFGFTADPEQFIFLKPRVTQEAARQYGFDFEYSSKPTWDTYQNLLEFAELIKQDIADLKPKDMIDLQSFIWVQGSDEY